MNLRTLTLVSGSALAIALVLLVPWPGAESVTSTPFLASETLDGGAPANLVGASTAPGMAAASGAVDAAKALSGATDVAGALAPLTPAGAAEAAAAATTPAADLVTEALALAAEAGRPATPAEEARLRAQAAGLPEGFQADLAALLRGLRDGAALLERSQAGLTAEERARLPGLALDAARAMRDPHLAEGERAARVGAFDALAARVDPVLTAAAGLRIAEAIDSFNVQLPQHLPALSLATGDVLFQDSSGYIVVGGPAPTQYGDFHLLIVDVGGDDTYEDSAGGAMRGYPYPVSVVIDVAGNDVYNPAPAGASSYSAFLVQGAGLLGVGALVDLQGDDQYSSQVGLTKGMYATYDLLMSQGFGALGVGLHVDGLGNDQYASYNTLALDEGDSTFRVALSQGAAYWGLGLLVNAAGADAYNSFNEVTARRAEAHGYATYAVKFCQGSGTRAGAGALVEGADLGNLLSLAVSVPGEVRALGPRGGSDHYNSENRVSSVGGVRVGGYGSDSTVASLACQGAGTSNLDPTQWTPVPDPTTLVTAYTGVAVPTSGVALGLLVDALGEDRYNSANHLVAVGTNRADGVNSDCRSCHAGATLTVDVNQGATGSLGYRGSEDGNHGSQRYPSASPALVAGVLVDGAGSDWYNTANVLDTTGFIFELRPKSDTTAITTYQVSRSQGFAGSLEGDAKAGASPLPPFCLNIGLAQACPGSVPLPCAAVMGTAGAGLLGRVPVATPQCEIGVFVDGAGSDALNSDNRLSSHDAERNEEYFSVDTSQGSSLQGGLGVHVNGLTHLQGSAFAFVRTWAIVPTPCDGSLGQPCLEGAWIDAEGGGSDAYNSRNTAPQSTSFVVSRSLGASTSGYALFLDGNLAAVGGNQYYQAHMLGFPPTFLDAMVGGGSWNSDTYSSWNTCTLFISTRTYGHTGSGLAAFAEALGSDVYDQNPRCGAGVTTFAFAEADSGIALFVELGGTDAYPASWSAIGNPPPVDDTFFLNTGGRVSLFADQLSVLG